MGGIILEFINADSAIRAGISGGTVVFILLAAAKYLNLRGTNFLFLLGGIFTKKSNQSAEMIGFLLHIVACIFFAFAYAVIFENSQISRIVTGLIISTIHFSLVAAGLGICILCKPGFRSKVFSGFSQNGFTTTAYDTFVLLILHLVYGITFGIVYVKATC